MSAFLEHSSDGSILAGAADHLFWKQHFDRPHIRFQLMAAKNEIEYNLLAELAGYKIKPKKKRHKSR